MNKKILSLLFCLSVLLSCFNLPTFAAPDDTIIILYENDVHCNVDGYAKLAAMKKELQKTHEYVGVVSSGDYVQGDTLGAISQGAYIIELMNLVGYDAVALGNHEFDYRLDRLFELANMMDTKPICCNFQKNDAQEPCFAPYSIVNYGDVKIAYIGITTPRTILSAFPLQFKDENGEYAYTFHIENLAEVVQENIDEVKAKGADYVIALSHMGYGEKGAGPDVTDIIENTEGLDIVLDAHSHSVIEQMLLKDKGGNDVVLSSTGTEFEYIGKLTISDGMISTELLKTESYASEDAVVRARISEIREEYSEVGDRKVGESLVYLNTHDAQGNRLVRKQETNLGNLFSDAFRLVMEADISYVNGGGMRAPIEAGEISFNDLYKVYPFGNRVVVIEVTGKTIKDMLEMIMLLYPEEEGTFPHVSGMTFSVNAAIPSSVRLDNQGQFVGVDGAYRVYNLCVLNNETGEYEPMDLEKTYTMASVDYYALDHAGGLSMLANSEVLRNEGIFDVELVEYYITEYLGGVIGEEYQSVNNRITFTDGYTADITERYTDLNANAWYSPAVSYVLEKNLMQGVSETVFAPEDEMSRAMAATVLWRLEGCPVVNYAMRFSDVDDESWYGEAVRWASAEGIINGYTETVFAPDDFMTREQLASILWRYAKSKGMDVSVGEDTNILSYTDVFSVSEYAIPAFQWCCGSGVICGDTQSTLAPKQNATRVQLAAMLHRFYNLVK